MLFLISANLLNFSISIFSEEHIAAAKETFERTGKKIKAHIKLDTGMNRIGVTKDEAIEFIKKVQSCDFIDLQGIFSHLANSEVEDLTQKQFEIFNNIISNIDTKNGRIYQYIWYISNLLKQSVLYVATKDDYRYMEVR